jgi:hypothetical protein
MRNKNLELLWDLYFKNVRAPRTCVLKISVLLGLVFENISDSRTWCVENISASRTCVLKTSALLGLVC